jgi:hypothetical protein
LFNDALKSEMATAKEAFMLLVAHFLDERARADIDNDDDDETFSEDQGNTAASDLQEAGGDEADNDLIGEGALERCTPAARVKQLLAVFFGAAPGRPRLCALAAACLVPVLRRVVYSRRSSSPFTHLKSPLVAGHLLASLQANSLDNSASVRLLLAEALACPSGIHIYIYCARADISSNHRRRANFYQTDSRIATVESNSTSRVATSARNR